MTRKTLTFASCGIGRMGSLVASIARERGHRVALELDSKTNVEGSGLSREAMRGVDVVFEFSRAGAALLNARRAAEGGCAVVVGTTGWDEARAREELMRLAEVHGVGIMAAPNFSLAMRIFRKIVEAAALAAANDAELDVWIEESHHAGKADHPSGTALMLARTALEHLPRKHDILTLLPDGPVPRDRLLVTSSRGGYEPGLHRVVIDGADECITLVHQARSRRAFASGAVRAAEWLAGRKGCYTLDDMLAGDGRGGLT
jgi:4-hydroxy-tetrahydrodipicolinate reductase